MPEPRWELLPHFVLRSTGFPFDWLERMAFVDTEAALDALSAEEQSTAQARGVFISALREDSNQDTARLRRRWCERATQNRPVSLDDAACQSLGADLVMRGTEWNEQLICLADAEARARETFARELRARRAVLLDLVRDEHFQEAVWLSSPQMLEHGVQPYVNGWDAERRPSDVRRVERQLIAYLQRVCAKNETTSFFGPINYGDFESATVDTTRRPHLGAGGVQRREAFVAYWGVAALASALAADPAIKLYLRPSLSPLCRLDLDLGNAVVASTATVALSSEARRILPLVDANTRTIQVAETLGLPVDAVVAELETLARQRVVLVEPKPPVTEARPLSWLRSFVADLPRQCAGRAHWLSELSALECLESDFASAALAQRMALLTAIERRFERTTGLDPRRKGGELYADRLLVYEECVGGLSPLSLSPAAYAALTDQLAPVLEVLAAHACSTQADLRTMGSRLLAGLAPDGGLPLLDLLASMRDGNGASEPTSSPWTDAIRERVAQHPDARELVLDVAELPPIDRAAFGQETLVTSPDVLLLADDEAALRHGEFRVVLGECHDTLMLWGWPLKLHPEGERLERKAADLLQRGRGRHSVEPANVLASKRVKITPFEYPGATIEIFATSEKPLEERIPIADVTATVADGRPVLQVPGRNPLNLYNGELHSFAHRLFGLPRVVAPTFAPGSHTPRLVLGNVIVQRERWCLARERLLPGRYSGTSFELMRDWHQTRRRLGLPRFVFARVDGERKPVLVDASNYFLLELLDSLAKPGTDVVLTEMLPAPDQFWMRDESGRYCSELRLSAAYAYPPEGMVPD